MNPSEVVVLISDDEEELKMAVDVPPAATAVEGEASLLLSQHWDSHAPGADADIIVQACSHSPFCLYVYTDLLLHDGRVISAVLVGYFNQNAGVIAVRLLHTLTLNSDVGASAARLLIGALNRLRLPLSNLAVFHCNAEQAELRQALEAELRRFSPRLVSLGGVPGLASRASRAGLQPSFAHVVTLVRDVHRHCSSNALVNPSLKQVFGGGASSSEVLVLRSVYRMVGCWRDLLDHFKSLSAKDSAQDGAQDGAQRDAQQDAQRIREQLMDHGVKLDFLFLSHALEPLRILEDLQRSGSPLLADQFQLLAVVARSYADRYLTQSAAGELLRSWDEKLLHSKGAVLSLAEVSLSPETRDFMWATPEVDLSQQRRCNFLQRGMAFYKAVLKSIVDDAPKPLDDDTLKSLSTIMKHPDNADDGELYHRMLPALAAQLGVSTPHVPKSRQLASEYLRMIKSEQIRSAGGGIHCWTRMLKMAAVASPLQRLLLTLLALPSSLKTELVFSKVVSSSKAVDAPRPKASPRAAVGVARRRRASGVHSAPRWNEEHSSSSDSEAAAPRAGRPPRSLTFRNSAEDSDHGTTSDSSDVICVNETSPCSPIRRTPQLHMRFQACVEGGARVSCSPTSGPAESVYVLSEDEDQRAVETSDPEPEAFSAGQLVWGRVPGFSPWPGVILPSTDQNSQQDNRKVHWYGQDVNLQINMKNLTPFKDFRETFCLKSFSLLKVYKEGISKALQEMAKRKSKTFCSDPKDGAVLLTEMMDWAAQGFKDPPPSKAVDRKSSSSKKTTSCSNPFSSKMKQLEVSLTRLPPRLLPPQHKVAHREGGERAREQRERERSRRDREREWRRTRRRNRAWREEQRGRSNKKLYREYNKVNKVNHRVNATSGVYTQPDQKHREETIRRIVDSNLDIEGFCLCCGTEDVLISHPLFKGSLCCKCKDNFAETVYRYDEDGYQSYCTVCCYGMEVVLCGNDSCCRSFCKDCVDILVGAGAFDLVKSSDPWICYMCRPEGAHGALRPRHDWSARLQQLFTDNAAMEFEPHRVYPSIPANLRRPLRILSLFDGIATGFLVLKELGFKVDTYVASEICKDSIAVSTINHEGKILHVGDVRSITPEHLDSWGPFDLLIGGSPCNDLACVNPIRKGLYEGSGRLFFDYYRILHLLKPKDNDPRPFFWLFENVVHMNTCDKIGICRFLECNPVLVDAVLVSPAHRARYFWGNIPGMRRPITASQSDKLQLQECLELGREARVTKVRTITTNPNCLKLDSKSSTLPVLQSGEEDTLWVTEMERIFGFPKHYTDVRNMNKQQRQKVLGRSWSVPVIRHLLVPLKDYYACEQLLPASSSALNHAYSSALNHTSGSALNYTSGSALNHGFTTTSNTTLTPTSNISDSTSNGSSKNSLNPNLSSTPTSNSTLNAPLISTSNTTKDHAFNSTFNTPIDHAFNPTSNTPIDHAFNPTSNTPIDHAFNPTSNTHIDHAFNSTFNTPIDNAFNSTFNTPIDHAFNPTFNTPIDHAFNPTSNTPIDHAFNPTSNTPIDHAFNSTSNTPIDHAFNPTSNTPIDHAFNPTSNTPIDHAFNPTSNTTIDHAFNSTFNTTIDHAFNSTSNISESTSNGLSNSTSNPILNSTSKTSLNSSSIIPDCNLNSTLNTSESTVNNFTSTLNNVDSNSNSTLNNVNSNLNKSDLTLNSTLNTSNSTLNTSDSTLNNSDSTLNNSDSTLNNSESTLNTLDSTLNNPNSNLKNSDSTLDSTLNNSNIHLKELKLQLKQL